METIRNSGNLNQGNSSSCDEILKRNMQFGAGNAELAAGCLHQ
jgi:hypothetical protein